MNDDEQDEITVLDYFAAAVMGAMVTSFSRSPEQLAEMAYRQADAMMAERNRRRTLTNPQETQVGNTL